MDNDNKNLSENFIHLQEIRIPDKVHGHSQVIPEAIPAPQNTNIEYGTMAMPIMVGVQEKIQDSRERSPTVDELTKQLMEKKAQIFSMDLQLKAIEKQLEGFKFASNSEYYSAMNTKIRLSSKYQELVIEKSRLESQINGNGKGKGEYKKNEDLIEHNKKIFQNIQMVNDKTQVNKNQEECCEGDDCCQSDDCKNCVECCRACLTILECLAVLGECLGALA